MEPVELPPEALEESFPYRPLRVADFGAAAPPASIAPHAGRINARACLQIRLREESVVHVTQTILDGRPWYFGTVRDPAFEARMIPACSWWNPEVPAPRRAYVLQHEQIHFALMEVAARRLTDEARRTFAEWVAVEPTVPALREAVTRKLAETIEAGQVAVLEEQTEFDNDTSRVYDPRAQQRWFEEVTSALAEAPTAH
jgi:hypothetical protein